MIAWESFIDATRDALAAGDIDGFLELTRESGASSAMFLQNVSCGGSYQPAMVALGLLKVDAHHDPEGAGTLTFYGGTGARVVQMGGSLAAAEASK